MKAELEIKLVKKYPNLYCNYKGDMRTTCMAWGMECGDGWYKIIDELSAKLEPLGVIAAQVKEKFGGLSFYLESCDENVFEEAHAAVEEAESKAYSTCEQCGEPGKQTGRGWIMTLCDICSIELKIKKGPVD